MKRKTIFVIFFLGYLGLVLFIIHCFKVIGQLSDDVQKYVKYYRLMVEWFKKRLSGKRVGEYLNNNGIKSVAIYGAGDMGRLLCNELESYPIEVKYFIDRNQVEYDKHNVYTINDDVEMVDAVIVTPFLDFDNISETLRYGIYTEVISLEDIIYDY